GSPTAPRDCRRRHANALPTHATTKTTAPTTTGPRPGPRRVRAALDCSVLARSESVPLYGMLLAFAGPGSVTRAGTGWPGVAALPRALSGGTTPGPLGANVAVSVGSSETPSH